MNVEFPLVKFTDRAFNVNQEHYLLICRHISTDYKKNGNKKKKIRRFYFKIAAECLTDEALAVLADMMLN